MIRQSTCYWPFGSIPLEEFCTTVKSIGFASVELLDGPAWTIARRHGLDCAVGVTPGCKLEDGFCDPRFHDANVADLTEWIPKAAAAGVRALACVSGNRRGISDADGLRHCRAGLSRILPLAEKHGVVLLMELLNSRIDHPDYMGDRSTWGFQLCKDLASPSFKILFDFYHMQVMEGDLIRTVSENLGHIGHFHTAGNPGRCEIDENQEINYPAIVRRLAALGYTGYIGHEFMPRQPDKIAALRRAFEICST